MHWSMKTVFTVLVIALFACEGSESSAEGSETGNAADGGTADATSQSCEQIGEDSVSFGATCEAKATDYPGESWMSCVSDNGNWNLAGESAPSSAARIASFEVIADLLWRRDSAPTADDFLNARIEYAIDNGLDSRVQRRYDAHVERPMEGINCRGEDHGSLYPTYCVGPGQILPILTEAFAAGSMGEAPLVNAAKVEAGLLWFLYVSTYKEAYTCKDTVKDCDSSWAYYGGADTVDGATGLATYVRTISEDTHAAIYNALLGVRCWRDLDQGEAPDFLATNSELHAQVLSQLDSTLDRGFAKILVAKIDQISGCNEAGATANRAFLAIAGPQIQRALEAADTDVAAEVAPLWSGELSESDLAVIRDGLTTVFNCD